MKAITEHYDDFGIDEGIVESKELVDVILKSLDLVDFYDGRDHDYVLINVMGAFGNLINVLAEKKVLTASDINRIVPVRITNLEE